MKLNIQTLTNSSAAEDISGLVVMAQKRKRIEGSDKHIRIHQPAHVLAQFLEKKESLCPV